MNRIAVLYALSASVLFGLSTPLAKMLVGSVDPWVLAGLFYLGSGVGLGVLRLAQPRRTEREKPLDRADAIWLAGAIVFGGIVAPILLMVGLARTEAATASLLLTFEGVATAAIAWFVFRENFDRRIFVGMVSIVAGIAVLSWPGQAALGSVLGPLAVLGACLGWGIDNNLTRKASLADPIQIAALKGLVAAPVTLALAYAAGADVPEWRTILFAAVVGFFGYGVSLSLFVLALRHLGTARTGAYFSTAPFIGAVAAIPLLGEAVTPHPAVAGALIGVGVWLHLTERHQHTHAHARLQHSHAHRHDDAHHRHEHGLGVGEPHSHEHVHQPLEHTHAHAPDSHHPHTHTAA